MRVFFLAVALALPAAAQPLFPGGPGGGGPPGPPADPSGPFGPPGFPDDPSAGAPASVPVDGGLGLLALAGGAYALRRLRSR